MLSRPPLRTQITSFFGVGVLAAMLHYGVLIALVEIGRFGPVPATLAGYVAGGVASYALNRRLTYASDRPHREATWRFAIVAFAGFLITWGIMGALAWAVGARFRLWHIYLAAQLATTGIVLFWSFIAHKLWTFSAGDGGGSRDEASRPRR